ncbi:MAG: GAF domain-containing SpoIIE family protein phosphatase [Crocinitomicaceae bacterium]
MSYITDKLLSELERKIIDKDFKLNSLLEITNSINSSKPFSEILTIYNFILKEQLGVKRFILFNKEESWKMLLKVGIKGSIKELNIEEDILKFKEITVIESSYKAYMNEFDVIVPVLHKGKVLAYLILGGLQEMKSSEGSPLANLNFIQTLTNLIVVAIENKRLFKDNLKQEVIKKELEVASEMQKLLFPSDLPHTNKLDISAKYLPHHKVSGDYYDYIQINENEFIICIADVSGKGISAAMLMANFQATLRTVFNYQRFDLEFLISELNKKVFKNANGEKFITFFISQYNSKTRKMKYVNAGHNWPILINKQKDQFLSKGCIGLGMFEELPFLESEEIDILPNTTLLLFTDGVVELENEYNEQFETDRLTKIAKSFYPLSMEDLNEIIFGKLDEWRGSKNYVDDTAILSCRIF